jgi:hypothetical protein
VAWKELKEGKGSKDTYNTVLPNVALGTLVFRMRIEEYYLLGYNAI